MVGLRGSLTRYVPHLEWAWLVLRDDSALLEGAAEERSWRGGRGGEGGGGRGCVDEGRRGVDVAGPGEEDVGFHVDKVGTSPPHVFSIVDDGYH